jgi:hypothetical protein
LKNVIFDEQHRIIEIHHGIGGPYFIPVGDTLSPAEVADWIRHIKEKVWGSLILGELVTMFNRLIPGLVLMMKE